MERANDISAKDAAANWFVRLRDDAVSAADRAAFRAWHDADPTHAAAYLEMERLWAGLDQVETQPTDRIGGKRVHTGVTAHGRSRGLRRMAVAASVALLLLAGAYAASPVGLLAEHRTGAGERHSVALEDGSMLELNTATAVSTDYSRRQRRIELHTGEIFLQVHGNANRPFVVDAGSARIEVLGTAFAVRRSADGVDVIVTENKVSVTAPDREAAIVSAGQRIQVTDTGLGPVSDANEQTALAWRRGRLVFESRPLSEVLSELDRYRPGRILIVDGALEHIPVTGSFANDRSDTALETIERTLPVRLVRLSDFLVLVFADDES